MRLRVLATAAAALLLGSAIAAAQGMQPGTVKLLTHNPILSDASSGDGYVQVSDTEPAKFLIVGPAKLQVDCRVNLGASAASGPDVMVDVYGAGQQLKRFKVSPKAGTAAWSGNGAVKPSAPIGFFIQVDPGPHPYELRVTGAAAGAAFLIEPAEKSKHPLAASAPVVPPKPPAPAATPVPTSTAVAVMRPTPAPTPVHKSLDQIAATGRAADAPVDRLAYEVSLHGGLAIPGDSAFASGPQSGVSVRWGLGRSRAVGVGLEVDAMQFGGTRAKDPHRALPPEAINVQLVPVIAQGTFWVPLRGRLRPYVVAGPGFVYGASSNQSLSSTVHETSTGLAAAASAGLQIDLAPGDIREGSRKVFVEAGGGWYGLSFASHPYDTWTTTSAVAGVQIKF